MNESILQVCLPITKPWGMADTSEDRIQRDLNRLEKVPDKNFLEFNKEKSKAPQAGEG